MSHFKKFNLEDSAQTFTDSEKKQKKPSAIIKKSNTRSVDSIKVINPYETTKIPENKGNITPLIDNDQIIGFIYECSCGEIGKVIFDFE